MITRNEHVQWCQNRALEYLDRGDLDNAFASMMSDITKHKETSNHVGIELGMDLRIIGGLSTTNEMRRWITGFN